jgi:hypothetical protein
MGARARAGAFVGGGVCAVAAVAKTKNAAAVKGSKYIFSFMP